MAKVTFEEVRLMNEGKPISPQVMSDSVKNLDGTPYTNHNHDSRYYTETEIDDKLSKKSDKGHTHTKSDISDFDHTHDERYYTESEANNLFLKMPKLYALPTDKHNGHTVHLDDMAIGDTAFVYGTFPMDVDNFLTVVDGKNSGYDDRSYFVCKWSESTNFSISDENEASIKTGLYGKILYSRNNDVSTYYQLTLRLFIMRLL